MKFFNNCTEEWASEEAKKVNIFIRQFCLKWYHKSVTDSFIPQNNFLFTGFPLVKSSSIGWGRENIGISFGVYNREKQVNFPIHFHHSGGLLSCGLLSFASGSLRYCYDPWHTFPGRFATVEQAMQAKDTLNGADIYTGCNTLKIEFSKVLHVKNIQYLNFGQEFIILHNIKRQTFYTH